MTILCHLPFANISLLSIQTKRRPWAAFSRFLPRQNVFSCRLSVYWLNRRYCIPWHSSSQSGYAKTYPTLSVFIGETRSVPSRPTRLLDLVSRFRLANSLFSKELAKHQKWRWRESNPRPNTRNTNVYRFSRLSNCRSRLG